MYSVKTKNYNETKEFAKNLSAEFTKGGIIALTGDLGAGKTTFAQGFAEGLGIKEKIISPTFLIIRQYEVPEAKNVLYHIDLYRLEKVDLKTSGLAEILEEPSNIVLIEWSEKIAGFLPEKTKKISLRKLSEDLHEIEVLN